MWLSGQIAVWSKSLVMRRLAILEPLLMFGLIAAYIWKLRLAHPYWWIAIPVLMFLSHWLHGENPRALGFDLPNRWDRLRRLAPALGLIALLLLSAGLLIGTLRQIGFAGVLLALAAYLPWGLAQQYAINGYFLRRFDAALSTRASSLVTAVLFSAAHAPNPFLMAVTLPLGWGSTLLYRRTRNLYLLGVAHAAIGLLLFLVVPDSVSRHLRVGPGWFRH
jgi:membrane protease YdiL (CAAX protease family)